MKKICNIISTYKLYILTFLVSLLVISIIYILNNVTPFGNKSLLCIDFFHQYGPMLGEFYDRIHSGKNLLYSFNLGLGIPFFRNFLNYMSSPFNIIILFFSRNNLLMSFSFVIGLKAIVSSCTLVYFLSHKFKTKSLALIPLGVLYAFSAYYGAYYWNIMWLDGMVFLPLITLGIEYIINEHKWKFYTIWLAVMLISNYFIGYMICFFSMLYFIIYSIYKFDISKKNIKENLKTFLKNSLKFAGASILAGMIAAVFLIPLYYSISSISATGDRFPISQYYKFTIEDFLKYHLTGVSTTVLKSDPINAPNISAGILSVLLLLVFIFNSKISLKTKICYFLLLSFYIIAFFWAPLDYILQAFHVPNDLPYRYSFLYTFVLIIICSYSVINIKQISAKKIQFIYLGLMLTLIFTLTNSWNGMDNLMIFINMIFLSAYFLIYLFIKYKPKFKNILILLLIGITGVDSIISIHTNWDITHDEKSFYFEYNDTQETLQNINDLDENLFYRLDKTSTLTFSDPAWYNYYGLTTFSSMAYESMAKLQNLLGMPGNQINSYYYSGTTPIYDLMFDIAYIIGEKNDKKRYLDLELETQTVYKFLYTIGLGYGVNNNLKQWNPNYFSPFKNENDYMEKATGISNILEKIEPTSIILLNSEDNHNVMKYEFDNSHNNMYFYTNTYEIEYFIIDGVLYYKNDAFSNNENIYNELQYTSMDSYGEEKIININSSEDKIVIYISYYTYDDNNFMDNLFQVYSINDEKFISAYNILKKNQLNITKFEESYIEGTINLDNNMFVYTSIPYDEGWHVYVDDQEVNTFKLGNALLAFDASAGQHNIKLKYIPKGFVTGLISTIIGLAILIGFTIKDKFRKQKQKKA